VHFRSERGQRSWDTGIGHAVALWLSDNLNLGTALVTPPNVVLVADDTDTVRYVKVIDELSAFIEKKQVRDMDHFREFLVAPITRTD
jgi:hypothetical protein